MNSALKQAILHSDIITEIIANNKAIAIYLGGSRLEGLDSSDSDYDIVVLGTNDDVYCYKNKTIVIGDYNINLQTSNINYFIELLKKPWETTSIWNCQYVLDFLLLTDDKMLYSTSYYQSLKAAFKNMKGQITVFAFDKIFQTLRRKIAPPFTTYSKKYYVLIKYCYFLNAFIRSGTLKLTAFEQVSLITIRTDKILPSDIATYYEHKAMKYPNYYSRAINYQNLYQGVPKLG